MRKRVPNDDQGNEGTVFALQKSAVAWVASGDDVGAIYLDVTDAEDQSKKPTMARLAIAINRSLAIELRDQLNSFIEGN